MLRAGTACRQWQRDAAYGACPPSQCKCRASLTCDPAHAARLWSAATCRRFPLPRPGAEGLGTSSATSRLREKAVTSHRTPGLGERSWRLFLHELAVLDFKHTLHLPGKVERMCHY